jgi:heavy metal sensor kinase
MTLVLALFVCLMTWMIRSHIHQTIDSHLAEEARELAEEIQRQPTNAEILSRFNHFYVEHGGFSFQVSTRDGTVLCGSPWLRAFHLPTFHDVQTPDFTSINEMKFGDVGLHRIYSRMVMGPDQPLLLHVVTPHQEIERELSDFVEMLLLSGLISIACSCLIGMLLTQRVLEPLAKITTAAETISTENLGLSIAVENPGDEVGRLATTLNETFKRLRSSMDEIRRFTSDAAHELRTPLAIMQTEAEVSLRQNRDETQVRQSLATVLEQAQRLTSVVDQLLTLSRQETQEGSQLFEEVYLEPLILDVVSTLRPPAQDKGIQLQLDRLPACAVSGDDILLSRLLLNLLDNAIKYTPAGGTVTVSGKLIGSTIQLQVKDTGIGIDPQHLPHIFDRFYRVDRSRYDCTGGVGLGLAICESIVRMHRGKILVTSEPGSGTTFTVELPLMTLIEPIHELEEIQHA